jgi:D-sedoheptulose 7-phosphate isomerase
LRFGTTEDGVDMHLNEDIFHVSTMLRESAETILLAERHAEQIVAAGKLLVQALQQGAAVLTAGNGGSAAEAMHMAEELTGRFRGNRRSLPGIALNADGTLMTCIGNDFGFDDIFSRQVEGIGRAGDVLVLFSTSGNAMNLQNAVAAARARNMQVIGVLGRNGGHLAGACDVELLFQGNATERIQEVHQVVMHIWLDMVENAFGESGE